MLPRVQHYHLIEELGKGGMGIVYKAEDARLKRIVALKVLSPQFAGDSQIKKRFIREAQLAASLQHQNICTIHDIGETEEKQLYISMDYYEGVTLQNLIAGEPIELDRLLDYAIQISEGISAAHTKGIIHRDIKPGNMIITKEGQVKILDFGLAKQPGSYDSTRSGKAMGTLSYLSPEQALGQKVDHLSDIWSLGVLMYEMATGVLPFSHEYEAAVIYSILEKSPLPPTEIRDDLPEELERIIYKCLRKKKEKRYRSAGEITQELSRLCTNAERLPQKTTKGVPEKKRIISERRLVTIIASEIAHYPRLIKNLGEEGSNQILKRFLDMCASTSGKYGGSFSWIGKGEFTITFGLPESLEKAPLLAVKTGMELQRKVAEFQLSLQMGINSGMVLYNPVSMDEKDEWNLSGNTLLFANRLKELAAAGQILVGPMIFRNTNKVIAYKALRPTSSAKNEEAVPIYQLLSRKKDDKEAGRMSYSNMVGREEEMDVLQYQLLKLIHGEGGIVSIVGEAGLGKSRLVAELLKKEEINRVQVLEGRALSTGKNLSFHPLIDILKDLADIKEADVEELALHKLQNKVKHLCPDSHEEVFPFIATLMGLKMSGTSAELIKQVEGEGLEKLILKNLRHLFSGAAQKKPLVFIIEDLHWVDQSSMGMLKSLFRLAQNQAILFINVLRPDYPETGELIREAIRDRYEPIYTEIILKSLSESQSEQLIQELLHKHPLPKKICNQINKRVEGNPFFIEEVIHSLLDEKLISMESGKAHVTTSIDSVVIPPTIHEVLMSRIDKLDEDSRALIKLASVIGRQFFYSLILAVAGSESGVEKKLEYLESYQLIRKRKRMDEVEYLFRHALIHQAVYHTIPVAQQKEMHLKVARSIEKVFQARLPDFYGTLAYHYSGAEELDRAEHYLIQAGERALRSSASSEALHYFKEALGIYMERHGDRADQSKIATLHKYIGIAYFNTGHLIEAADHLEQVLSFYGMKIPDNPVLLRIKMIKGLLIFLFRIRFTSFMGRKIPDKLDVEINNLINKKASALVLTDNKRFLKAMLIYVPWLTGFSFKNPETLIMVAAIFSMGGISLSLCSKITDYYIAHTNQEDLRSKITGSFGRITTDLLMGNWEETSLDEEMVEKGFLIGESFNLVNYVPLLAQVLIELGNRQAEEVLEKHLEWSEMYENDFGRLSYYTHCSLYLLKYMEYRKALDKANAGIEFISKNLGNKPGLLMIYSIKIRSQILLGDLDEAEKTLGVARDFVSRERQAPFFLSFYLTACLLYYTRRYEQVMQGGDKNQLPVLRKNAIKTARRAKKVSDKAAYERVETYRLTGVLFWLCSKPEKAIKWWARAIEAAEQLGAKPELAFTLKELVKRLSEPSSNYSDFKGESVDALKQRAKALFKDLKLPTS